MLDRRACKMCYGPLSFEYEVCEHCVRYPDIDTKPTQETYDAMMDAKYKEKMDWVKPYHGATPGPTEDEIKRAKRISELVAETRAKEIADIKEMAGRVGVEFIPYEPRKEREGDQIKCDRCSGVYFYGHPHACGPKPHPMINQHYDPNWEELMGEAPRKGDKKDTNPKDAVGIRKVPFSCMSGPVMAEVGLGMLEGACKYGRHNYRVIGVRASVYFDAAQRHLWGWWEGQDTDPDSGIHHVSKLIADLMVLRDAMIRGNWVDDRPPRTEDKWVAEANDKAAAILDRYPNPVPAYTEAA